MNCDFVPISNEARRPHVCQRCGQKTKPTGSKKIIYECRAWPRWWELGYWAEHFLAFAGINQTRFNAIRRLCGFTKPCGCGQRIETLNESGGWLRDRVDVALALWRRLLA